MVSESRGKNENSEDDRQTKTANPAPGLSGVEFNARVARKAYDLFERRGRNEGHDVEDWLEAERQVREELLRQNEAVAS
jgi:hypothetical protein